MGKLLPEMGPRNVAANPDALDAHLPAEKEKRLKSTRPTGQLARTTPALGLHGALSG